MSLAASKRNASRTYTKGIGGIRPDIGHYVRSSWEANFARYLIFTKQEYEFEPNIFNLIDDKNTIHYKPDFKTGETYFEIKGWWTDRSKKIRELMKQQYPEIEIKYISELEYNAIQLAFAPLIPSWEKKARRQCK